MALHDCAAFERALAAALEHDAELAAAARDAALACPACRDVLRSVTTAIGELPEPVEPSSELGARAIRRSGRAARRIWMLLQLTSALCGLGLVMLWIVYVDWRLPAWWSSAGPPADFTIREAVRAALITATVGWFGYLATFPGSASRRPRLYARWHRRQLQGICAGLGAYYNVPPWLVRVVFVVALVTGLGGGTIYVLLAFVMTFHPDDRQHLTWFRIRRFFARQRVART